MIHETLRPFAVPIGDLTPHPQNVRQGDVGLIAQSLRTHGQYRAIVAQEATNRILAGNHTWKAAKSLGWKEIAVHFVAVDDDRALRILLADNKANDAATYDDAELAELLKALTATEDGLTGTLYDGDDLDSLLSLVSEDDLSETLAAIGDEYAERFHVVVECADADEQGNVLRRLAAEGLRVRAATE
jgi:ParB-like chromosome segregation protein Spo0J